MALVFRIWKAALVLAALTACTGGSGGPMGEVSRGGSLDGGNYAAGPVSLPTSATLNKNLIVCENVSGPRVECRGSDGAAPANAHLKLTVYSRFSALEKRWMDYLIPSAQALVGNTDFCEANAAGAFGQSGDCSVVAAAGEKVGICVAGADNLCVGPELLITVPVEGATASGASGTIKSLSVDPNGDVIFGKAPAKPWWKRIAWSEWLIGSARAEQPGSAPLLALPSPVLSTCPVGVQPSFSSYEAPEGETVTIRRKNSDESVTDLFRLPGTQRDLGPIYAGTIGNPAYISVALKNTLYIVTPQDHQVLAQRVFPARIRHLARVAGANDLSVFLDVPQGLIGLYTVQPDTFNLSCVNKPEVFSFNIPDSFSEILGSIPTPGGVPLYFRVYGGAGYVAINDEYQVILRQEAQGDVPAWDGAVYRQATPLRDFEFLYLSPARVVAAVLDTEANRILLIRRELVGGETEVTPVSLAGVTEMPVAMRLLERHFGTPRFLLLDSGERGAKAVTLPILGLDTGEVSLLPTRAQTKVLGPIVANLLEPGGEEGKDWVTYDLVSGEVFRFDPNVFGAVPAP